MDRDNSRWEIITRKRFRTACQIFLFADRPQGIYINFQNKEEFMKKSCVLIAVLFSSIVFCTKESPTDVSSKGEYTDSIVLDMLAYTVFNTRHNTNYFDSIVFTANGQPFIKEIDTTVVKSIFTQGSFNTFIVPKYKPTRFEAWAYDSLPMITFDETDSRVVVKSYNKSSNQFYGLDTASANLDAKCITQIPTISYDYGYGFSLQRFESWGLGKVKIYYK
jgi:hypothetical protein